MFKKLIGEIKSEADKAKEFAREQYNDVVKLVDSDKEDQSKHHKISAKQAAFLHLKLSHAMDVVESASRVPAHMIDMSDEDGAAWLKKEEFEARKVAIDTLKDIALALKLDIAIDTE
jgi:hypothetical protein